MLSEAYAHDINKLIGLVQDGILSCEEFSSYAVFLADEQNADWILEAIPVEVADEFKAWVRDFDPDAILGFGRPPFVVNGKLSDRAKRSLAILQSRVE